MIDPQSYRVRVGGFLKCFKLKTNKYKKNWWMPYPCKNDDFSCNFVWLVSLYFILVGLLYFDSASLWLASEKATEIYNVNTIKRSHNAT